MIVYKYRDWNNTNHRSILTKNEIYLPSPKDFNDPFDCRISENLTLLDSDSKIEDYIDYTFELEGLPQTAPNYLSLRQDLKERLKTKKGELQKDIDDFSNERLDNYTGVFCLTKYWDNILMWSHYASSHSGFCIGFDFNVLNDSGLFNQGSPVDYPPDYPKIDPLEKDFIKTAIAQTTIKSIDWIYESEYRFIKVFWPNMPIDKDRIITIPNDCIKEIIIGLNFPSSEINCLKASLNKRVDIFKIEKIPYTFKLNRTKI